MSKINSTCSSCINYLESRDWCTLNRERTDETASCMEHWPFFVNKPQVLYDSDEKYLIAKNMKSFGGSFVKKLGEAILAADQVNLLKLQRAFPEYFDKYKKM